MLEKNNINIWVWLLLVAVGSTILVFHTRYSTDISVFLPESAANNKSVMLQLNKTQQQQSASLLMIVLEGADVKTLAQASREMKQRLAADAQFNYVLNGASKLASESAELLYKYRYLLDTSIDEHTFTVANLRKEFSLRLQELSSPAAPLVKRTLTADPLANSRKVFSAWQRGQQLTKVFGVWFNTEKTAALLIADIRLSGYDIDKQSAAINQVRQVFDQVKSGQMQMNISGPGVFAVATRAAIVDDSTRLGTLGTVAILFIFLLAYRSLRLIILGSLPIVTAVIVAIAVTGQVFSNIHGITIAFGVTLLGICTDYPVHLFSHLQHGIARAQQASIVRDIWPTMRLGMLTTCIGFAAMLNTAFSGLSQLGVFAITGLVTAALVTRYVLPGLIPSQGVSRARLLSDTLAVKLTQPLLPKVKWIVLGLALIVSVSTLLPVSWEDDLSAISPLSETTKKLDQKMRQQLHIPDLNHIAYVEANSADEVLEKSAALKTALEKLVTDGIIQTYQAAFQYLPAIRQQRYTQSLLPDAGTLRANLAQALAGSVFNPASFEPFIMAINAAKTQTPLDYAMLRDQPLALPLKNLLLETDNGKWYGFIRFGGVKDVTALKQWSDTISTVQYVNIKQATSDMVFSFRDEAVQRMAWGLLVLIIVLALGLRNIKRTVTISLILLLTVGLVVSSLNILGTSLSLFHIISLLLVVGLGLDYSLFFTRKEHSEQARRNTLHGLFICFSSTFIVFTILSMSALPVLQSIGVTVMLGVLYSFVFAWLFSTLPAQATLKEIAR